MVELYDITYAEVYVIKELWEKNRLYHEKSSEYFKDAYRNICFEDRIKAFSTVDSNELKITVAKEGDVYVGYCLSTIVNGKGEVESLHVAEACRGKGIGRQLMEKHLDWMKESDCKIIGVTVSQENEPTIAFYRELGFYPNTLYMQQKLEG